MKRYPALLILCLISTIAACQGADPITFIQQAIGKAGDDTALRAVRGVSVTGTVTYHWADHEVSGKATALMRGIDAVRIDAALPNGKRVLCVDGPSGFVEEIDGRSWNLSTANAVAYRAGLLPSLELVAILRDHPLMTSSLTMLDGEPAIKISYLRAGRLPTNLYINRTTGFVLRIESAIAPAGAETEGYLHRLDYSDYRVVEGLFVPTRITEALGSESIWTLTVDGFSVDLGTAPSELK